jgi:prepilin-type N-terminal cleavage/methylation domain-containing protein/prepilin-type processing-associated H-X9-DG protein
MRNRSRAFTLVELLVVIGIIALLISILLPALNKARESAKTIKCASNLHNIGAGMAIYIANFHGVFPPSNIYNGLQVDASGQSPTSPTNGFLHWSALIFNNAYASSPPYANFRTTSGWEMFQCPSLDKGGLPPANTFAGNNDLGLSNDAGADVVDLQAPRLAYTVNEALCPRGYFVRLTPAPATVNLPYHFVQAARVRDSSNVVLATEISGVQSANESTGLVSGAPVSNSRRPVNGLLAISFNASYPMSALNTNWLWAKPSNMHVNPQVELSPGGVSVQTTLDYIGRNHGALKLGTVGGDTRGGWDLRKTNFLYVDGHVETKHVSETTFPTSQWGSEMYTLDN